MPLKAKEEVCYLSSPLATKPGLGKLELRGAGTRSVQG